jgi:hypothetical protein
MSRITRAVEESSGNGRVLSGYLYVNSDKGDSVKVAMRYALDR